MSQRKGPGRPRIHEYEGIKKNFCIRLSDPERALLEFKHGTVQKAVQIMIADLEMELEDSVKFGARNLPSDS